MPRPHPQAPVPAAVTLRRATLQDLAAIEALERASFRSDRLSHRALRHWLRAANGLFLVAVSAGQLLGCALAVQRSDSTAAGSSSYTPTPTRRIPAASRFAA